MKKYLQSIAVLLLLSNYLSAQTPKASPPIKATVALQNTVVYKSFRELPSYLTLVKTGADINKNASIKNQPKASIGGKNSKSSTDNPFIITPFLFPAGMNPSNGISPSKFVDESDVRIVLLTTELTPEKQRAIFPVKNSDGFLFLLSASMGNGVFKSQVLETGWKVTINGDGSFCLAGNKSGGRLGILGTGVSMMPETEQTKTKFIAYQHGRCSSVPIWLYNPASKTFLGRTIDGGSLKLTVVKIDDALHSRVPAGVDIKWDFTRFKAYSTFQSFPTYFEFKKLASNAGNGTSPDDHDGDGAEAVECGGTDCNDDDPKSFPGKSEICDPDNRDEDCDPSTCGVLDMDGDGYINQRCFNTDATGRIVSQGTDCNDNNLAIYPGVQYFISETRVGVCGMGEFDVGEGFKAVYQYNGTAIIVPK